ncbi:hypothetical protein P7K49_022930 [Saguinus oedipus]|uniref:Uncharacterized protein n=1 Tax=Saguinus oedipus TaxID=9490 RepID=A0ABQ9UKZ6_SAGOE|nr:hypothetical protein P7K49_022930 [Saguinus oedipus]
MGYAVKPAAGIFLRSNAAVTCHISRYLIPRDLCVAIRAACAWIKVEQLKPYHAHKEEMIKINKGKRFQQAVDAVEEFLRRAKGKDQTSSHNSADDKNRRNSSEERSRPNSGDEKRKLSLSEGKVKKNMGEGKKRVSSGSSERGSKSPLKRAQEQSPRKRGRPPKDEKERGRIVSSKMKGTEARWLEKQLGDEAITKQ